MQILTDGPLCPGVQVQLRPLRRGDPTLGHHEASRPAGRDDAGATPRTCAGPDARSPDAGTLRESSAAEVGGNAGPAAATAAAGTTTATTAATADATADPNAATAASTTAPAVGGATTTEQDAGAGAATSIGPEYQQFPAGKHLPPESTCFRNGSRVPTGTGGPQTSRRPPWKSGAHRQR